MVTYRTKRPRTRAILSFGVGATLAITQLGAGCVPADRYRRCSDAAAVDEAGECVSPAGPVADGGTTDDGATDGADAK